jgi:hypothetical protein
MAANAVSDGDPFTVVRAGSDEVLPLELLAVRLRLE